MEFDEQPYLELREFKVLRNSKLPPKTIKAGKDVRLADLKATGDQTNKRSEKQYKYEEKMCG